MQGTNYRVESDIWSLGLSLVELGIGRYPIPPPDGKELKAIFGDLYKEELNPSSPSNTSGSYLSRSPIPSSSGGQQSSTSSNDVTRLSIFELLDYIVHGPAPTVPVGVFSSEFKEFVDTCLKKNPNERANLKTLMVRLIN